jgi:subtilisin family serine protease
LIFVLVYEGRHSASNQEEYSSQEEYVPNELLIKFKKNTERSKIQQSIESVRGKIITYLGEEIYSFDWAPDNSILRSFLADPDLFHIKVPDYIGEERAISLLSFDPNVEYVEKNFIGHADAVIPNDPHFSKLWGLRNTGQTGGKSDADIDAPEAWDIHKGSTSIVVAVIDSGIDYNHEDLQANIWNNPGETGGGKETNGIDDDGNGYIDDWRGWNFVHNSNNPMDDYSPKYHGTHVAGTIGAKGNNGKGVVGVCWNVKLMALKWIDGFTGKGTTANVIRAIDYSTANGARLSNNSWHVPNTSSLLSAIDRAQKSGKIFISSAGNEKRNNDYYGNYPSNYDLDNIIAVLASDHNDNISPFSNYGWYTVDVGAPGGTDSYPSQATRNIYSTARYDAYQYMSGTSMAAPHVAGQAALIWAHRPALNWWKVKTIIMKSVDKKGSFSGKCASGGRINAYSALITPTPNLPTAPSNLKAIVYGSDVKLTWKDNSGNESGFEIYLKNGSIFVLYDWTGPNVTTYWDYDLFPGYYTYYVRAYKQDGNSTRTLYVTAKII